jgi:peptidoglycan hydrolase-like protein with peptidoglycan-binding domain
VAAATALVAGAPGVAAARELTLDGPGATYRGHQVTFTGRLSPPERDVEVGVYLGSSVVARARTNERGFFVVRPDLFTSGAYRARAPGAVSPPQHVEIRLRRLDAGDEGAAVRRLVQRLAELGYAVADPDASAFGGAVMQSVWAFQKAQGIAVDGVVGPVTRARLADPEPVAARYSSPPAHLEVDKRRQLLLVVEDGEVVRVVNASTAGIPGYTTPEGRFRVFRRVRGIDTSPLGRLWNPLYFYRGYAIHGSTTVPPRPASHGCVRVPLWEAERLFATIPHGEVVYVY